MKKINILFLSILFCLIIIVQEKVTAQAVNYKINGFVVDTLGKALPDKRVKFIINKDTIQTITDKAGAFFFVTNKQGRALFKVADSQYSELTFDVAIDSSKPILNLAPFVIKENVKVLDEVKIVAKRLPVIFKKDTIEYNSESYRKNPDDLLKDLLSRLPGVSIDNQGNVVQDGHIINKLRVNGKDFFTSKLSDFLNQLPSDIIDKIQVVNDYGDEAAFTGLKTGEPGKLINLVIKPNMDHGVFGYLEGSAGTNKQYSTSANGNFWDSSKQYSVSGKVDDMQNNTSSQQTETGNIVIRSPLSSKSIIYADYNYARSQNAYNSFIYSETFLNPDGIITNTASDRKSLNNNHLINLQLDYNPNRYNYLRVSSVSKFLAGNSDSRSTSSLTGDLNQLLREQGNTSNTSNSFSNNVLYGHRFSKTGRVLTFEINATLDKTSDRTGSFDSLTTTNKFGLVDSIFNQNVFDITNNSSIYGKITYIEPLSSNSSLNILYSNSYSSQKNSLNTTSFIELPNKDFKEFGAVFESITKKQLFDLNYQFVGKKITVNAGANFQPSVLIGNEQTENSKTKTNASVYSPHLNIIYIASATNSFNLSYISTITSPTADQMNPAKDSRNLQNIVIGNPDLKQSKINNLNWTLRHSKNSTSLSFNVDLKQVKDQVVKNIIIQKDSSNKPQQETHYINAPNSLSGTAGYSLFLSFPTMLKQPVVLNMQGNASVTNSPVYSNNVEIPNKTFSTNHSATASITLKKFAMSFAGAYSYSGSNITATNFQVANFKTVTLSSSLGVFFTHALMLNLNGAKNINAGYRTAPSNPLIINASIKQKLFKRNSGELSLQVFDLLKQANNFSSTVVNNTVSENRIDLQTRYIKLSFIYNLRKFGNTQY